MALRLEACILYQPHALFAGGVEPTPATPPPPFSTPSPCLQGEYTTEELMAMDSDVIRQCMEVQSSQKLRNEEARNARAALRKNSTRFRWDPPP